MISRETKLLSLVSELKMEESVLVAIYNFSPSTVDWPFKREGQRLLPLRVGDKLEVIYGSEKDDWWQGKLVSGKGTRGYFPRNYTVTVTEWERLLREGAVQLPSSGVEIEEIDEVAAGLTENPAETVLNSAENPMLSAEAPVQTLYSPTRSKMANTMPGVPNAAPLASAALPASTNPARQQSRQGLAVDTNVAGIVSDSRVSTPATYALGRPEKDFVRSHLPMDAQSRLLREVGDINNVRLPAGSLAEQSLFSNSATFSNVYNNMKGKMESVPEEADLGQEGGRASKPYSGIPGGPAYVSDLRIRATTSRIASGIEPPHTRIAMEVARTRGKRWTLMFRPGLNDMVNEAVKMGKDPAILSNLYLYDFAAREQFLRQHLKETAGTLWFDLQRRKPHLFYMRMDFVDVMMFHPDAWGFPDASNVVLGNPGEPFDPFHGWFEQSPGELEHQVSDVVFSLSNRKRSLPESVFQAIALGKVPDWLKEVSQLQVDLDNAAVQESVEGLSQKDMLSAGLVDTEEVYVRLDELKVNRGRSVGPDVLSSVIERFRVSSLDGLRLYLRSRGSPDAHAIVITPKQLKQIAFDLGINNNHHFYWFALYALRYPVPPGWEVLVSNDSRYYVKLADQTDDAEGKTIIQGVHPMMAQFREQLADAMENDFLWDLRGFMKIKCSECSVPDSVVWCQQCTDNFCVDCFLKSHKRRKVAHYALPIPGCSYLNESSSKALGKHIDLLNVGYCNRRRFLALDNQSDKTGDCQCQWLYFGRDAFEAALNICPEAHCKLERVQPPRLAPDAQGFYYNFAHDMIAENPDFISQKTAEQRALLLIQRWLRGALVRSRIAKMAAAAVMIQKFKRMWDSQKYFGKHGSNAKILRAWYRRFQARNADALLELRISKVQGLIRGRHTRRRLAMMRKSAVLIQSTWRGIATRVLLKERNDAATDIQRVVSGVWYGREPVRRMQWAAKKIQSVFRGRKQHSIASHKSRCMGLLRASCRSFVVRSRVKRAVKAAIMIQSAWRRWQDSITVKVLVLQELERLEKERQRVLKEKTMNLAATLIQRNIRKHLDRKKCVQMRDARSKTYRPVSTLLGQLLLSLGSVRSFVHPWWRHLPPGLRKKLEELKTPVQRAIAKHPVSGKIVDERFLGEKYHGSPRLIRLPPPGDDLAAEILLTVIKEILPPASPEENEQERLKSVIAWTTYAIGHEAVHLKDALHNRGLERTEVKLSEDQGDGVNVAAGCRPGEPLLTLFDELQPLNSLNDRRLGLGPENFWLLVLSGVPEEKVRRVCLTAETLITVREALEQPRLKMESNLAFQGVDATGAAQIFDVLSAELQHRLPVEWSTSSQHKTGSSCAEIVQKMLAYFPKLAEQSPSPLQADPMSKAHRKKITHFTRSAVLRVVQQLGTLLSKSADRLEGGSGTSKAAKRREILEVESLFHLAKKNVYQEHTPFVLGVVLLHLTIRGLLLRLLYDRAATSIQVAFRYYKVRTYIRKIIGPVLKIQTHWRGAQAAIKVFKIQQACKRIQHNFRTLRARRRNAHLVSSVVKLQAFGRRFLQRMWLGRLETSAVRLQSAFRAHLARSAFASAEGRNLLQQYRAQVAEYASPRRGEHLDATFLARRAVLLAQTKLAVHIVRQRVIDVKKVRARQAQQRVEQYRATLGETATAPLPERLSVFEPPALARSRLGRAPPAVSTKRSEVLVQCDATKREYETSGLPMATKEKRNAVAVIARRGLAAKTSKRVKTATGKTGLSDVLVVPSDYDKWEFDLLRSSIPYFPKFVIRGVLSGGATPNQLRVAHLFSTAVVYSFISRHDGRRPAMGPRFPTVHPHVVAVQASPLAEHVSRAVALITAKLLNDSELKSGGEALSSWEKACGSAAAIWRGLFSFAHTSEVVEDAAVPFFFCLATESASGAMKSLLAHQWLVANEQFTTRMKDGGKYRGLKFRPEWSTMEQVMDLALRQRAHMTVSEISAQGSTTGSSGLSRSRAAKLDDFVEDFVLARFGVDFLERSLDDMHETMDSFVRRRVKALMSATHVKADGKGKGGHSGAAFSSVFVDDAETRGILATCEHLIHGAKTLAQDPRAQSVGVVASLLSGVWTGMSLVAGRIVENYVTTTTSAMASKRLPAVPLGKNDGYPSRHSEWIADSHVKPDADYLGMLSKTPKGTLGLISKLQASWRGYRVRKIHWRRLKMEANYSRVSGWPYADQTTQANASVPESPTSAKSPNALSDRKPLDSNKKSADVKDASTYKPQMASFLGGIADASRPASRGGVTHHAGGSVGSNSGQVGPDLIQADHVACGNLFFLYLYNVWVNGEMLRIWRAMSLAYERVLERFGALLIKNPHLQPMAEAVAAQLKRRVIATDDVKAGGAGKKLAGGQKGAAQEDFLSRKAGAPVVSANKSRAPGASASGPSSGNGEATMQPTGDAQPGDGPSVSSIAAELGDLGRDAQDYLRAYLVDMEGDDTQFKDIEAMYVIPLSSGSANSPPRQRPEDLLLGLAAAKGQRVDAEWCLARLQPMWLGIKPTRFSACRARITNALRSPELVKHFTDHEKAGNFTACIKLLEGTKIGNLNVFTPAEIVAKQPFWVEMVIHLVVGYIGLCVKNKQPEKACALVTQTISILPVALRDLHPVHRNVLMAYVFDTALGVAFACPTDTQLRARTQQFFHEASERYLAVKHINRYAKCCLRYSCVLHIQGHAHEAEYFAAQAAQKLADAPPSSLVAVAHLNRSILVAVQRRVADAEMHARTAAAILRHLPQLKSEFVQAFDNASWLIRKLKELWPVSSQQLAH